MLKKFFFLFVFAFLSFFYSCSNSGTEDLSENPSSLKAAAEKKISGTDWTFELEKDRLTQDISAVNSIEKKIKLTPQVLLNSNYAAKLDPVYPYLEGFGSLDTSNFNPEIKKMSTEFASGLCKNQFSTAFFDASDIYELALFSLELKNRWKETFGLPYPGSEEEASEKSPLSSEQNSEKQNPAEQKGGEGAEKSAEKAVILFDEYLLGEPFQMNSLCEVPVRFVLKDTGFADIMLFFAKNTEAKWKIDQLQILKMQGKSETGENVDKSGR